MEDEPRHTREFSGNFSHRYRGPLKVLWDGVAGYFDRFPLYLGLSALTLLPLVGAAILMTLGVFWSFLYEETIGVVIFYTFLVLFALLTIALTLFAMGLFFLVGLKVSAGHKVELRATIFEVGRRYWSFAGTLITTSLIVGIGLVLLIVPGIIFLGSYGLAPLAALEKPQTVSQALTHARKLSRGYTLEIAALLVALSATTTVIAAFTPFGLAGDVLILGIEGLALALMYRQLHHRREHYLKPPLLSWGAFTVILGALMIILAGVAASVRPLSANFFQEQPLQLQLEEDGTGEDELIIPSQV